MTAGPPGRAVPNGSAASSAYGEIQETPDVYGEFPVLGPRHVSTLAAIGEYRDTQPGDVLYEEGDSQCDFYVIVQGLVVVLEGGTENSTVVGVHGPGRFLGELGLLTGEAVFTTAIVHSSGKVLVVAVDRLRELVSSKPDLGDIILRAYLARRSKLLELGSGLRIVGSRFAAETRRLRDFAARNRLPHRFVDVEQDAGADALIRDLGVLPQDTPVVVWGQKVLRNPRPAELARAIGLLTPVLADAAVDLLVVGAGPAGLAAAVYGASEGLVTVIVDSVATGGQASLSPRIENYLGFPSGVSGYELSSRAVVQSEKFGARIAVPAEANALEDAGGCYRVVVGSGDRTERIEARTVLIATGARYRRIDVPGSEQLEGISIYYAATMVEAQLCAGDPVVVVGGGNSAGQASLFLADHTEKVVLLVRGSDISAHMSRYLVDQLLRSPVEVRIRTEVHALQSAEGSLRDVVVFDATKGEEEAIAARAMFVFIGSEPRVAWLRGRVGLDEKGFVLTGTAADRSRQSLAHRGQRCGGALETDLAGVFAAGDVRSGSIKRVAAAVGEGAMAVQLVHGYLRDRGT